MNITKITTEEEYDICVARIYELGEKMTPDDESEFLQLCALEKEYADANYPISEPSPEASIAFRKDQETIDTND